MPSILARFHKAHVSKVIIAAMLASVAAAALPTITLVNASGGTNLLTDSFTGSSVNSDNWVDVGSAFTPCLTASTNTTQTPVPGCANGATGLPAGGDAAGSGALRLTNNGGNESGALLYNKALPTQAGLSVTFNTYQYDESSSKGADGISFFAINGADSLTSPGVSGGFLGYGGCPSGESTCDTIGTGPGVDNGLFGVGLDVFGNYSNWQTGDCPGYSPTAIPEEVAIRGPMGSGGDETGYCWLGGSGNLGTTALDEPSAASRSSALRTVTVTVDPPSDASPQITVVVDNASGTQIADVSEPEPTLPPTFKFGFASSTGGDNEIHEINTLAVNTINPLDPSWDLAGTTSGTFTAGGTADYLFTPTADTAWGPESDAVTITDTLENGSTVASLPSGTSWDCSATVIGSTTASCTYTPTGPIAPGTTLPTITVPAQLPTASGAINNSATVSSSDNNPTDAGNVKLTSQVVAPGTTSVTAETPLNTAYQVTVPAPVGTGPFTYALTSTPNASYGTATIGSTTGLLTFTPANNTSGIVPTFDYQVTDNGGNKSADTPINLTVTPLASPLTLTGNGPGFLANTPTGALGTGPFTYSLVTASLPANTYGTTAINGTTGEITFDPAYGFMGPVPTYYYIATGPDGTASPNAAVNVTVGEPSAPTGLSNINTSIAANFTFYDTPTPPTGATPYTWSLLSSPAEGTASIDSGSGEITYTPPTNYSGPSGSFTYEATDQYGQSDTATVNIAVTPETPGMLAAADGPSPISTTAPTSIGTGPFAYSLVSTPPAADGVATINDATGVVTFTPVSGYYGTVPTFYYKAMDAYGQYTPQEPVNITVTEPPGPSGLNNYNKTTTVNTPISFTPANPTSGSAPYTWSLASVPDNSYGTFTINPTTGEITYTPANNFSGGPTFMEYGEPVTVIDLEYEVTDQYGQSTTADTYYTVNPTTSNLAASGTGPSSITTATPTSLGTTPFTYSLVSTPPAADGTASIDTSTGAVTFTPAAGFSGDVPTFDYQVQDGAGDPSADATVDITVNAPAAPSGLSNQNESTPLNTTLTYQPATPTGTAPFIWSILTPPNAMYGTASIDSSTGEITFVPATNFSGTVPAVFYEATDQYNQSDAATLNITVIPTTTNIGGTGQGPSPVVTGAPTSGGTAPFAYALTTLPSAADGSASINTNTGVVTFTPASGFWGTVPTFYFEATDDYGVSSNAASVDITVTEPPGPGGLHHLSKSGNVNSVETLTPPTPTGAGPFVWSLNNVPAASYGTFAIDNSTGVITYTPATNYTGNVPSFQYAVTDQYGQSASDGVSITVIPTTTDLSATVQGPSAAVTGAPTTIGTGPFTYTLVRTLPPTADGVASINSLTGVVTFTPALGFLGTVPTFYYKATDANGVSSVATKVNIEVTEPPAPTTSNLVGATVSNTPLTLPTPTFTGAAPLTWSLLSLPPNADGVASINSTTGIVTFTPATNYSGIVPTFYYAITDQYGQQQSAKVNITVAPVASSIIASETAPNVLTTTPSASSGTGPFTYTLLGGSTLSGIGTATMDPNTGLLTFTPLLGFSGTVTSWTYEVTDADGVTSSPAAITLTVNNPAVPTASNVTGTTTANIPYTTTLPAPTGVGPFTYSLLTTLPANWGTMSLNATTGVFTYNPAKNISGKVPTIQYEVTDAYSQVGTATITLSVLPIAKSVSEVGTAPQQIALTLPSPTGTGPFTYHLVLSTLPSAAVGTASLHGNYLIFTPYSNFSGLVPTFQYEVTDAA
ncbi:MAG: beta strand repeat-containing protein, partial [Candidatus Saccharimonadales bacterium]